MEKHVEKGAKEDRLSKVKFAKLNRQIFKRPVFVEIIRVFVYSFLRKYFYIKPIRRWHLKHLYPDVLDMK